MICVELDGNTLLRARRVNPRPDGWLEVVVGVPGPDQIGIAQPMTFREITQTERSGDYLVPRAAAVEPAPDPVEAAELAALELEQRRAGMKLSVSQMIAGLAIEGWITEPEAETWLQGNGLPASALALIGTLPAPQQIIAKARLYRMSEAVRSDPLVTALAAAEGKTDVEIDTFFETYSQI